MTAPPGDARHQHNGITGTRTKAETKRRTTGRIVAAMTAAGMTPHGWQVRSLLASLRANEEEPTERELTEALMRAPWFKKPHIRRFGVGDPGWRTRS